MAGDEGQASRGKLVISEQSPVVSNRFRVSGFRFRSDECRVTSRERTGFRFQCQYRIVVPET